MTFHIGSQDADLINNVAGDQWNQVALRDDEAREQIRKLRRAVEGAGLPLALSQQAQAHLDQAEIDIRRGPGSKPAVSDRLKQLTQVLGSAGALASAGGALLGPLGALAGWLGGLGKPILDMLNRDA
jgi:hypothetical protein